MLNKLYVIGNKQKEIVERCFIHNRGTYISPMTDGDLFALTATQPVHKSHKNIEIFGLTKISMDHVKQEEEITEDEQHEKEQKLLEYKHIQDIHYFLPSFIVSQMLSSIIQFWIIWIMSTIGYFSLIFLAMVSKKSNIWSVSIDISSIINTRVYLHLFNE